MVNKYNVESYGPPDSINTLWYDPSINRFEDEDGYVRNDLHKYFGTWQLDRWKKAKDYAIMIDKNGDTWEIFYNHNGAYGRCGHICGACVSKCEIYACVCAWEREELYK